MKLSIIVAVSENGVIGRDNDLIWRLSADLKRFKQLTTGHPIIMGRKTYDSIGRPLPGRTSIVITRQLDYKPEGVHIMDSLEKAIAFAETLGSEEAFVIGGGEIYRLAIPLCQRLHITLVKAVVEGDTYFSIPQGAQWKEIYKEEHAADERNEFSYNFIGLEKI